MPHPFDQALDAARLAITAAPGPFRAGTLEAHGRLYPAFVEAPADMPAFFAQCCALHGPRPCLVDGDERLSFAQVHDLARRVARGLATRHGVAPGDHVAIAARNGAGWVVAYMGVLMAGGVATLVNGFWTGGEMAAAIRDTGCTLVLADRQRLKALEASPAPCGAPCLLLDLDLPVGRGMAPFMNDTAGPLPTPGPDAPATLLFTSGSTGQCKGALSDHRAKVQAAFHFAFASVMVATVLTQQGRPPDPAQATLLNLPLFHVTGEVNVMLQSFVLGRKMVVMRRWDAREALRLIEAERITYVTGVPLMGFELATHPDRGAFDLSSLSALAAGGAPRPAEHVPRLAAGLPAAAQTFGYGLTETNAIGTGIMGPAVVDLPITPGRATLPLVGIAIFGPDGTALAPGETGEIGIRSIANITGYWNRQRESAALFTADGHVLTGDLGHIDAEGYLHISGRAKDIIIRGGENIAAQDVEAALYALPEVQECAVFGVPDERLGEVPVATVWLSEGSGLDAGTIAESLLARLAPYKRPSRIVIAPAMLPRLGSEKIDKQAVRAAYLAGLCGQGGADSG